VLLLTWVDHSVFAHSKASARSAPAADGSLDLAPALPERAARTARESLVHGSKSSENTEIVASVNGRPLSSVSYPHGADPVRDDDLRADMDSPLLSSIGVSRCCVHRTGWLCPSSHRARSDRVGRRRILRDRWLRL